jgi:hypothetical protein
MKKFLIAEAEKARILGMHYNAMGKTLVNEALGDPGTILAAPREQAYVDKGMSYIGFTYYGENNVRKEYYYHCTANVDTKSSEINQPGNRAGDFMDSGGNYITPQQIGLKGDYMKELKGACQNIYTYFNNYKKTFCANPKNKTKDNYKWLCPQEAPQAQVAAATTTVNAPNPVSDADVAAKQKASQQSRLNTQQAQQQLTDKMADINYLNPNKEKAELDKDALEVYSLITSASPIGGELGLTVKNRLNRLIKSKPEYKQEPYNLNPVTMF